MSWGESQVHERFLTTQVDIIKEIASGGEGNVYFGHCSVHRRILIKKYYAVFGDDDKRIKEIGHLRQIRHKNIVQFFGGLYEEQNFQKRKKYACVGVLMEYLEGGDLWKAITDHNLALAQSHIAHQILSAVHFLHAFHNVTHRDIKPLNIFIAIDGTVKLGDFGLLRNRGSKVSVGKGTEEYLAPELLDADQYTTAGDIFSLAITLFELFARKNSGYNVHRPKRPNLKDIRKDFGDVADMIERGWNIETSKRPSAHVMMEYFLNKCGCEIEGNPWPITISANNHEAMPQIELLSLTNVGKQDRQQKCGNGSFAVQPNLRNAVDMPSPEFNTLKDQDLFNPLFIGNHEVDSPLGRLKVAIFNLKGYQESDPIKFALMQMLVEDNDIIFFRTACYSDDVYFKRQENDYKTFHSIQSLFSYGTTMSGVLVIVKRRLAAGPFTITRERRRFMRCARIGIMQRFEEMSSGKLENRRRLYDFCVANMDCSSTGFDRQRELLKNALSNCSDGTDSYFIIGDFNSIVDRFDLDVRGAKMNFERFFCSQSNEKSPSTSHNMHDQLFTSSPNVHNVRMRSVSEILPIAIDDEHKVVSFEISPDC